MYLKTSVRAPSITIVLNNFMDIHKDTKMACQVYDKDGRTDLILVVITPLMIRVHPNVYVLVDNAHFKIFLLCYFLITVVLRFFFI